AIPLCQVVGHSGPEASLGDAQQQPKGVKRAGIVDEGVEGGNSAPGDTDASQPGTRVDLCDDEIARDLKGGISDVEQGDTKRDLLLVDADCGGETMLGLGVHGKRVANVGTVGGAHKVHEPEYRNDARVENSGKR